MKIFIVCSRLGFGGAEHVATMWANGFEKKGYNVTLVSNLFEEKTFQINEGVKVRNFITSIDSKQRKWLSSIRNLRKLAKEERPDVIIGVMRVCSMIAKIATLGLSIPIIATEHNAYEWPKSNPMPFNARLFKFHLSKFFDGVTVLTEADRKLLGNKFKNVAVMPNPLSLTPSEQLNHQRENISLAVGRIDAWKVKGFDILICAWHKLLVSSSTIQDSSWWLKIAGAGKKESFEYLMNLLPDGNWIHNEDDNENWFWRSEKYHIEFLGFQKDMESLYKKSEIFVLSSRYEGFGLVLIEAMSQGCAPIACDYKGRQKEILCPEGVSRLFAKAHQQAVKSQDSSMEICENGILCEPDNVETLTVALKKMILDEKYRASTRTNVIERSKIYSIDKIINRWDKFLNKIVLTK